MFKIEVPSRIKKKLGYGALILSVFSGLGVGSHYVRDGKSIIPPMTDVDRDTISHRHLEVFIEAYDQGKPQALDYLSRYKNELSPEDFRVAISHMMVEEPDLTSNIGLPANPVDSIRVLVDTDAESITEIFSQEYTHYFQEENVDTVTLTFDWQVLIPQFSTATNTWQSEVVFLSMDVMMTKDGKVSKSFGFSGNPTASYDDVIDLINEKKPLDGRVSGLTIGVERDSHNKLTLTQPLSFEFDGNVPNDQIGLTGPLVLAPGTQVDIKMHHTGKVAPVREDGYIEYELVTGGSNPVKLWGTDRFSMRIQFVSYQPQFPGTLGYGVGVPSDTFITTVRLTPDQETAAKLLLNSLLEKNRKREER
jgi:hypothetical protein